MNPGYLVLAAGGVLLLMKGFSGNGSVPGLGGTNPQVTTSNPWGLPDIDRANQGGGFDQTYDESYEKASGATGVPFALIKAHAIRESSQNPSATHADSDTESSYGLLQVEWSTDSSSSLWNRLAKYGSDFSGSALSPPVDFMSVLCDPDHSAYLGASIIADNLNWLDAGGKKGIQGLRDTINAYNTGTTEAKHAAPNNYVNDVIGYYQQLIGENL